jgi:hypothetical protein
VLYVAAHPDDENTSLITYLARGRGYRTAYLSVTRGDGGQNELGPEFGEKLGLARTYELLAARQQDGGRQFFTRALDFGFTKDVNETLRIWDHKDVLGDVVRVFRTFRPDVVIAGMNPVQTRASTASTWPPRCSRSRPSSSPGIHGLSRADRGRAQALAAQAHFAERPPIRAKQQRQAGSVAPDD